jgi:hypothetical protein
MCTSPRAAQGTVVKGFGRGSKELGVPTANLDSESLQARRPRRALVTAWASHARRGRRANGAPSRRA